MRSGGFVSVRAVIAVALLIAAGLGMPRGLPAQGGFPGGKPITLIVPYAAGGTTEQVFNLNGLGKLLLEAVTRRDYTLTQALVMLSASTFVVMNLLVDLCYAWLDPRIRYR